MSIAITEATPQDWVSLRDLRLRALADAPDAFSETLVRAQDRDDAQWQALAAPRPDAVRLIARRDGVPVGMTVIVIDPNHTGRADLYAMWVAPEARRAGVGRQLVQAGLAWARRRAALTVSLRVSDRRPEAAALYRRCGFVPTGEREPLVPGSPITIEAMRCRLEPLVMGVVNVTPDSFSDGGTYLDPAAAIAHGEQLAGEGADLLDIGGEATNPRAKPVTAAEELRRIVPVIERLAAAGYRVSVDTTKAEVARVAVAAGATIVNDVAGGLFDPAMLPTVRALDVIYIAGHLRGRSLPEVFAAEGAVPWREVAAELDERVAGLPAERVWIDPGIGFGKGADPEGNVALVRHAGDIAATVGRPIVVGVSRKRFLRRLAGLAIGASDPATVEALDAASTLATIAALRAGAHVVRVHNVALLRTAWTAYNKK